MNQNHKNGHNGVRVAYIFGLLVCLCSIYFSGFNNNPLKDRQNLIVAIEKDKNKLTSDTMYHFLSEQSLAEFPVENPITPIVQNSIRIPIERRNSNGSGTAFKISSGAWITARHVVHGCRNVYLSNEFIKDIFIPPSSDLALLFSESASIEKFDLSWVPSFENKHRHFNASTIGDLGYSIGFPKGQPGQARLKFAGYVQMVQQGAYYLREPVKMWVETKRQPRSLDQMGGISGGPIFNREGTVVGVHVANSVRKGRAFSVDEYSISWLVMATSGKHQLKKESRKKEISDQNWSDLASTWRENGRIKKVICKI